MISLALFGATEGIVYLFRYRTAVGDNVPASVFWTLLTCGLRIAVIASGAAAIMRDTPLVWLILCYALPAAGATGVAHAFISGLAPGPDAHGEAPPSSGPPSRR